MCVTTRITTYLHVRIQTKEHINIHQDDSACDGDEIKHHVFRQCFGRLIKASLTYTIRAKTLLLIVSLPGTCDTTEWVKGPQSPRTGHNANTFNLKPLRTCAAFTTWTKLTSPGKWQLDLFIAWHDTVLLMNQKLVR